MKVLHVKGGATLRGTIRVSGSKNAALPILAAALLTDKACTFHNVPDLSDVRFMCEILKSLGAAVSHLGPNSLRIEAKTLVPHAPYELVRKMRASVCLMGPLLGRMRSCVISLPGGCVLGPRPIDLHLKGFSKLGCTLEMRNGYLYLDASGLQGANIFLGGRQGSTVTGTANMLTAAVLSPGITRIECAACEPEVTDLCHMLVKMGANIEGIGSPSLIIEGVSTLDGCEHTIIPDRIEAGTFLIAGLLAGDKLCIEHLNPLHLHAVLDKLEEGKASFEVDYQKGTLVASNSRHCIKPLEIVTLPYPGFPTDLQAQMATLMALTPGMSLITERIYNNRFMYVPELQRMGANIALEGATAIVNGQVRLSGAHVMASDLRASASLFLAALASEGETFIHRIYHLDRGYEHFDKKLAAVGAILERLDADDLSASSLPSDATESTA